MTATLTVAGVNVSAVARYDVTVEVGRDNVDSQPDASVLSAVVDGWRPAGQMGDPVKLTDSLGQLFAGTLTDLSADLEPGSKSDWSVNLTAVSTLADVGRTVVGDEPWPQESDSQRVKRVLDLAGVNTTAVNPGIVGPAILARDVDRKTALDIAQEVAGDAFGVLWEQPADPVTPIRYTPQRLRSWQPIAVAWGELAPDLNWSELPAGLTWNGWDSSVTGLPGAPVHLELHAGHVIAEIQLSQQIGDLIRKVRVTYGPEVEGAERPQAVVGSGTPEVTRDTQLAAEADALAVADTIWRSHREPAWQMRQVTIRPDLPPAVFAQIRSALAVGTKLTISSINFDSPIGPTWQGYLEGWRHELVDGAHRIVLNTSERIFTEPADRWQDITPTLQWQQIAPTLTWDQTGEMP